MSFILSIKNPPPWSTQWWADYLYAENYSGWLPIGESWNCRYGAYGYTDLRIMIIDDSHNILHSKSGLGPIYNDKNYVYDCSTGKLSETEEVAGWYLLDTKHITLTPSEVEVKDWFLLDTKTVTLIPSEEEVAGWFLLDEKVVTLTPTGVPPIPPIPPIYCTVDADCPPGYVCKDGVCVKKEDYGLLVLAGLVAAGVVLAPKEKKKVK